MSTQEYTAVMTSIYKSARRGKKLFEQPLKPKTVVMGREINTQMHE